MDPVTPAPEIPVELREVRKSFGDKPVLQGVSLALRKGTTLAVMGGSGAGKTVLLRITDGLIRPDAGQVTLFGTHIERMREASATAFLVALSGVIWPFLLGAGVGHLFGLSWTTACFLGGALTATSVSISARTLMDAGKMSSPEERYRRNPSCP